jgi:hypothetical protein
MTIENWLMIAVIISTLIAPAMAEYVKPRINHPTPAPDANQPKNLTQRIGFWIVRISNSPWILPPLLIVLNIYWLRVELHKSASVTRWTVYQMALDAAGLWYGVVLFFLNTAWGSIRHQWEINREQRETNKEIIDILRASNRSQSEIDRHIIDLISDLAKSIHVVARSLELAANNQLLESELAKPKQGRLRSVINKLLGK